MGGKQSAQREAMQIKREYANSTQTGPGPETTALLSAPTTTHYTASTRCTRFRLTNLKGLWFYTRFIRWKHLYVVLFCGSGWPSLRLEDLCRHGYNNEHTVKVVDHQSTMTIGFKQGTNSGLLYQSPVFCVSIHPNLVLMQILLLFIKHSCFGPVMIATAARGHITIVET